MRYEEALVCECSRTVVTEDGVGRIERLLREDLDWRYLMLVAMRHAIAPLLHHGLSEAGRHADLPAVPVMPELETIAAGARARSLRVYDVVAHVSNELEQEGIRALALKDVSLAVDTYPAPGLRPIGDVDLLVDKAEFAAAAAVLERLGFAKVPSSPTPFGDRYVAGRHYRSQDETWIDLQWMIGEREWDRHGDGRYTYDVAALWERARPSGIAGSPLLAPSHEDMLFHLCVHAEGHQFGELILLCDIAEFLRVRSHSLNWELVGAIAEEHDSLQTVRATLALTRCLLSVQAPESALESLPAGPYLGTVSSAVFGSLGALHESLDDLAHAAASARVLRRSEVIVRRQAVRAMRLGGELADMAAAFVDHGGRAIAFDGRPSSRTTPEPRLSAFHPMELFVLVADEPAFRATLATLGFDAHRGTRDRWLAQREWSTNDPVLADGPTRLDLALELTRTFPDVREPSEGGRRRRALAPIGARLQGRASDDTRAVVSIVVRCLTPEQFILAACTRFASARRARLQALWALAAAVEPVLPLVDAEDLSRLAEGRGL
ncbi:MAG: nucleotidyltransferase domain-containing protein, partial [Gaiellaceae bacterium]